MADGSEIAPGVNNSSSTRSLPKILTQTRLLDWCPLLKCRVPTQMFCKLDTVFSLVRYCCMSVHDATVNLVEIRIKDGNWIFLVCCSCTSIRVVIATIYLENNLLLVLQQQENITRPMERKTTRRRRRQQDIFHENLT